MASLLLEDCWRCRYLFLNAIISIIIGGILYGHSYLAIGYSSKYPPSNLVTSGWIWHIASRFMAMWYPFAFLLVHWRMRGSVYLTVFITGCVVGMVLSFISAIYLDVYSKTPTGVLDEYVSVTKKHSQNTSELPFWIHYDADNDCCTWPVEPSTNLTDIRPRFVKDLIEKCYNGKTILADNPNITHEEFVKLQGANTTGIVKSCDAKLINWVKKQHKLVLTSSVLISFFGMTSIILYAYHYVVLVKRPYIWSLLDDGSKTEMIAVPVEPFSTTYTDGPADEIEMDPYMSAPVPVPT